MTRHHFGVALGILGATALVVGCSSDKDNGTSPPAGGSSASAGAGSGAGGTAGSSTSAGAGGSTGGSAPSAGSAGAAGVTCVGDPPVTPHNSCATIASQKKGDTGFTVTSPAFTSCAEIPAANTCDGKDFGTGASPAFNWTGVPVGTLSLAVVFKDISILSDGNPDTEKYGYHWVMWDIPPTATGLPANMTGGYASTEVPGAHQWSTLGSYGFFTPCPNPFPKDAPQFMCSLTLDSYAFTVYALPVAKINNLPAPDLDATTGMPVAGSNWVVKMGHYIESLSAIAVTEYRGTSKAWAAAFVPPNAAEFPCSTPVASGGTGGSNGSSGGSSGSAGLGGKGGSGGTSAGGTSGSGGTSAGGTSGSGGSSAGATNAGGSGGSGGAATLCLR